MPGATAWLDAALAHYAPLPAELESPVAFAAKHSRGMYQRYRHLEVIEAAVLDAIRTGGRLLVSVSVRHGKSETISRWLPAWYLVRNPDKRIILAGHEAGFAAQWGRQARDIVTEYGPQYGVRVSDASKASNRWAIAGHEGGMLTVGVGGSPIGRGADLMIIDDPLKSFADAMSPLTRRKVNEWYTGTLTSRVQPGGAVIIVMARWHKEDLAGYLLRTDETGEWKELRLPALCDDPATDPMGRAMGEALWPEQWPADLLERRKKEVTADLGTRVWDAQYQGRPTAAEGGLFPEANWRTIPVTMVPQGLRWVRGWDLAATEGGGDWTVSVKMARTDDGQTIVADVERGQWNAHDVRARIKATAERDGWEVPIEIPQDPGQAGKDQAQQLVGMLAGHDVSTPSQSGAKETRAAGLAAQVQASNVVLVEGSWNPAWVAEFTDFPTGQNDDQVDAAATAYNKLATHTGVGIRHFG